MSDFAVRIDTAKLDAKQAAAVSAAMQRAVLAELGRLALGHPASPAGAITFHPERRGIRLRNLKDLQDIKAPQVLGVQARQDKPSL
ncbi:MAG: hypothetical protein ABI824_10490 [Acidobacteriota bacterium]